MIDSKEATDIRYRMAILSEKITSLREDFLLYRIEMSYRLTKLEGKGGFDLKSIFESIWTKIIILLILMIGNVTLIDAVRIAFK